jgi:ubiquinone/menaquinone biosynthesis C-methylase UbiE
MDGTRRTVTRTRTSVFDLGASVYDLLTRQDYWRAHIARALEFVEGPQRDLRVLDLGCGPGVSTFELAQRLGAEARLVGLDAAARMIGRARRRHARSFPELHNVCFERGDAAALAFSEASFDLVVGHSFLYLVADRGAVLREARRVLVPDGTLVLMEPSASGSLRRAARPIRRTAREALRRPWHASRFVTSMALWRLASARAGRMSPPLIERLFRDAGLRKAATHSTLGGLGLYCVAKR